MQKCVVVWRERVALSGLQICGVKRGKERRGRLGGTLETISASGFPTNLPPPSSSIKLILDIAVNPGGWVQSL